MLEQLETIIAYATIMSGISLLVTVMTQGISAVLNLRGRNLKVGLQALLTSTGHTDLGDLPEKILTHVLVSGSLFSKLKKGALKYLNLAKAVRTDEIVEILKLLKMDQKKIDEIKTSLDIWFDSTMDRVSQRFSQQMRVWTIVFSFIIAFGMHLDSGRLLHELANNSDVRDRLAAQADDLLQNYTKTPETGSVGQVVESEKRLEHIWTDLSASGVSLLEKQTFSGDLLSEGYRPNRHFAGILVSAIFLSLGAPFWFNLLKSLVGLKPVVAQKIQQESEKPQPETGIQK